MCMLHVCMNVVFIGFGGEFFFLFCWVFFPVSPCFRHTESCSHFVCASRSRNIKTGNIRYNNEIYSFFYPVRARKNKKNYTRRVLYDEMEKVQQLNRRVQ